MSHGASRFARWIVPVVLSASVLPLVGAGPAVASGTVPQPSISVTDTWVAEGNSGTVNASFQVSLSSAPESGTVSVQVATANGLAASGSDYTALAPTTLTWSSVDPLAQTVTVAVKGDTVKEATEKFSLNLSNPVNAVIADSQGVATIVGEEAPFFVYARDAAVTEGNSGTKVMTFTLSLSAAPPVGQSASVNVATANGGAAAPGDYTAIGLTTKTFGAGVSSVPVSVTIKGDAAVEPNETVNLNLSAPSPNTVIGDPQGVGTIINDDGTPGAAVKPSVYVTNLYAREGNTGTTTPSFVVTLSTAPTSGQTVKVNVATANGTATAGSDYTAKTTTTLTYTAGQSSKTVAVSITGDARKENNETFSLVLSAPVNAVLGDATGAVTVLDEEGPFVAYASDAAIVEGDSGTTNLAFTLSLSSAPPAGQSVTFKVATTNDTAAAPGDYTSVPLTLKTFGAGVSSMAVNVAVSGDPNIEADETLALDLSVPSGNVAIGDAKAVGTLLDDDGPPNPVIGPEEAVGDVTYAPAAGSQSVSAVAWNGTNYLVVWQDEATQDIRASRVAPDGTVLDQHSIAITGNGQDPAVAWDGTNFVVVWSDYRFGSSANIYGARVSSAGTVLDPAGILVSAAADSQLEVAIASNGTESLITWRDERAGFFADDIYGTRLSSAGTVLNPGGIQVGSAASVQFEPAVAWNGTNYYVVWADNRAGTDTYDIYGTSVSAAGSVTSVSGTAISTAAHEQYAPAITSNGNDFFVAWHDHRSNTSYDIYSTRIDSAGTVLSASGTLISNAAADQWNPSVVWNGTNYGVSWQDQRSGGSSPEDIYMTRVSTAGAVLDAGGIVVSDAARAQRLPALASDGTDFFAAWVDERHLNFDIFAARITSASMVEDASGILVSSDLPDEANPAIAWNGTNYLMVWEDKRSSSSVDIYGARLAEDGTILDPGGIPISTVAGDAQTRPAVAWDGTNFLVVWEDVRDFATGGGPLCTFCTDIYGARVDSNGTVLDPSGIPISTADDHQNAPAVAWNGQTYLVTWTDSRALQSFNRRDVFGALVNPSGTVTTNDISIATSAADAAVASNGTDFVVAWTGATGLYSTRVTGTGSVLDPSGVAISTAAGGQSSPSIVWNATDNTYLVTWADGRSGSSSDIYGAFMDNTGQLVGSAATGIPISTATRNQSVPAAAADDTGFIIVWADERAGTGKLDIFGARLSAAGVVQDPGGLAVSASASAETLPAIVEGPSGTHRAIYQRQVPEVPYDGVNRVFSRSITPA